MNEAKIERPSELLRDETDTRSVMSERLAATFRRAKEEKIPVVVLFEGWGASGKGYMIEKLIEELDPRSFKVWSIKDATEEEKRFPMLKRYWEKLPINGNLAIFDRSWYREVSISRVEEKISKKKLEMYFDEIQEFEKQLVDDGCKIIKIFLHITKKEQAARFEALEASPATKWRVSEDDRKRHKKFDAYDDAFTEMIGRTDTPEAPWHVIDAQNRKETAKAVIAVVDREVEKAIVEKAARKLDPNYDRKDPRIDLDLYESTRTNPIPDCVRIDSKIHPEPIKPLDEYDLSLTVSDEEYDERLEKLQSELFELHNKLYMKKRPLIIAFEGWDAAGKGGSIKRLTSGLDPRGYEVIPVGVPTQVELAHQYLWRFWCALPKSGHIAIFDRTWYGRVMVERLEGFAKEREWSRAFDEMNKFERMLHREGAIIVKFWLHIDPDEQLRRFEDRQNTPEKQWKITPEDWRNRDKNPQYHIAVDQMLKLTNTSYAPWYVIESNSKKFARLKVLESVIHEIKCNL